MPGFYLPCGEDEQGLTIWEPHTPDIDPDRRHLRPRIRLTCVHEHACSTEMTSSWDASPPRRWV